MHKILLGIVVSLAIASCGTTYNFSAYSDADIKELYASCVGPHGSFEINHEGKPFIGMSIYRKENRTEIYLYKNSKLKSGEVVWPETAKFIVAGNEMQVTESSEVGQNVLQDGMAYFQYPGAPDQLSFELGVVYFNQVKVSVPRIEFTYEKRRYLMCVQ